jgi:deazaflavin-dependent oxidoreductase (nitroreductase family)
MSTFESAAHLFGDEHVQSYLETNGELGFRWREDAPIAILFTTGRTSGESRTNPLTFGRDGDAVVLVASKGGSPADPGWFRTLAANPEAEIQVMGDRWPVRARVAEGQERASGSGAR